MTSPTAPSGIPLDKAMDAIAKKFSQAIPQKNELPSSHVRLLFLERSNFGEIEFGVMCAMSGRDFARYLGEEKEEPTEKVVFVSDAFVHGGFYILYSSIFASMVCMKFATEIEAKAYASHYKMGAYMPSKQHISNAEDEWFDGTFPQQHPSFENRRLRSVLLQRYEAPSSDA